MAGTFNSVYADLIRMKTYRIGIDFDNTIVSYDSLFHTLALELSLISASLPQNKTAIRDFLRASGKESLWTEMQAVAYGTRITEAEAFPGVLEFIATAIGHGHSVAIVSHKTQYPYEGPQVDLHQAAIAWLTKNRLTESTRYFFEPTKELKMARIASTGCDVFIDDLPELLSHPDFPRISRRILFDPHAMHTETAEQHHLEVGTSWTEIHQRLL